MPRKKGIDYEIGSDTHTGMVRTENQDSIDIHYTADKAWRLMIVCDGMGGHAGGQKASSMAVQVIAEEFDRRIDDHHNAHETLNDAIIEANRAIFEEAQRNPELKGMGTTCVVLAVKEDKAYLAHVGDSRIYRIRPKVVERMTKDHSSVQKMVDGGLLSEEEAEDHPDSNILHRCIGAREELEPEIRGPEHIEKGDRYLLCSDGLTSLVEDQIIAAMTIINTPQEAVKKLIALANDRGGHDNTSVQILYRTGANRPKGKFNPDAFRRLPKPKIKKAVPLSLPVQESGPAYGGDYEEYEEDTPQYRPARRRELLFFLLGLFVGAVITASGFIVKNMITAESSEPTKGKKRPSDKTKKTPRRTIKVFKRYSGQGAKREAGQGAKREGRTERRRAPTPSDNFPFLEKRWPRPRRYRTIRKPTSQSALKSGKKPHRKGVSKHATPKKKYRGGYTREFYDGKGKYHKEGMGATAGGTAHGSVHAGTGNQGTDMGNPPSGNLRDKYNKGANPGTPDTTPKTPPPSKKGGTNPIIKVKQPPIVAAPSGGSKLGKTAPPKRAGPTGSSNTARKR